MNLKHARFIAAARQRLEEALEALNQAILAQKSKLSVMAASKDEYNVNNQNAGNVMLLSGLDSSEDDSEDDFYKFQGFLDILRLIAMEAEGCAVMTQIELNSAQDRRDAAAHDGDVFSEDQDIPSSDEMERLEDESNKARVDEARAKAILAHAEVIITFYYPSIHLIALV